VPRSVELAATHVVTKNESMGSHHVNRFAVECAWSAEHRILPEAELWTEVILQAIDDLDGRTSSGSRSAQDSARQWFASENDGIGSFVWSCRVVDVDPSRIRSVLGRRVVLEGARKRHHRSLL
jgi:hypothetical protein